MPLIDTPNVPIAPGVPDVRRSVGGVAARTGTIGLLENLRQFDIFGLEDSFFGPPWGVFDKEANLTIAPDSVISFSYRGEEKLATHPVEAGGFSTYNKVSMPYDIKMTIVCNGQGQMKRSEILTRLDDMKSSIDLFDIITPYYAYLSVNLTAFDYRQQSSKGVNLLMIEMQFEEVRETARVTNPPAQTPAGQSNVTIGTVKTREPIRSEPLEEGGFS